LWFSSVPSGECRDSTLKLGHNRFFPNILQFTYLPIIRFYTDLIIEEAL
jgi:hypothetical protein